MPRHFMFYFKFNSFNARLIRNLHRKCRYAASNQFYRITTGDILYIVTQKPDTKYLYLIARLAVVSVLPQLEAALFLGEHANELWQADFYAVTDDLAAERFKMIDLMPWLEDLRFVATPERDRLAVVNGIPSPQQLQTMRHLEPASAALLDDIWYTSHDELPDLLQTF